MKNLLKSIIADPNGRASSLRIFFLFWGILSFFIFAFDWFLGWQRVDLMALATILSGSAIGIAAQHITNVKSTTCNDEATTGQ